MMLAAAGATRPDDRADSPASHQEAGGEHPPGISRTFSKLL